ncbi:hypothetical protein IAU59_006330 [Kwoniella sp. CBS 9459]
MEDFPGSSRSNPGSRAGLSIFGDGLTEAMSASGNTGVTDQTIGGLSGELTGFHSDVLPGIDEASSDFRAIPVIDRDPLISSGNMTYFNPPFKDLPEDVKDVVQSFEETVDGLISDHLNLLESNVSGVGEGYGTEPSDKQLKILNDFVKAKHTFASRMNSTAHSAQHNGDTTSQAEWMNSRRSATDHANETLSRFDRAFEPFIHHHHEWIEDKAERMADSIRESATQILTEINKMLEQGLSRAMGREWLKERSKAQGCIDEHDKHNGLTSATYRLTRDREHRIIPLLQSTDENRLRAHRGLLWTNHVHSIVMDPYSAEDPDGPITIRNIPLSTATQVAIGENTVKMMGITRRFNSICRTEARNTAVEEELTQRPSDRALALLQEGFNLVDETAKTNGELKKLLYTTMKGSNDQGIDEASLQMLKDVWAVYDDSREKKRSFADSFRQYVTDKLPWTTDLIERATANNQEGQGLLSAMNQATRKANEFRSQSRPSINASLPEDLADPRVAQTEKGKGRASDYDTASTTRTQQDRDLPADETFTANTEGTLQTEPGQDMSIQKLEDLLKQWHKTGDDSVREYVRALPLIRATNVAAPSDHPIRQALEDHDRSVQALNAETLERQRLSSASAMRNDGQAGFDQATTIIGDGSDSFRVNPLDWRVKRPEQRRRR